MKNYKKIISLALTLAMISSAVFCTGVVANAEETVTLTTQYKDIYSDGKQYDDINFDSFGTNLFSDPTVSDFNGDTYNASGVFGSGFSWLSKLGGFALNDNSESHTKGDNSGVLKLTSTGNRGFALPSFEANSAYLITFWVKADSNSNNQIKIMTVGGNYPLETGYVAATFGKANEWHRVSMIASRQTAASMGIMIYNGSTKFYIDDIAVYKLDNAYAVKCMEAGELLPTDGHGNNNNESETNGQKKVTLETGSVNLTVDEGYFVPYGALSTKDGKMPVKQGDGSFNIEEAGEYYYTQFKYPTGAVGTFGASAKTDSPSGIQFGSLITNTSSIDANGATGTLVFRGDFEAFCATFENKSTQELVADIYAKMKKANIASGSAVKLKNGDAKVVAMYVDRTTYMWQSTDETELQYAVRVYGITEGDLATTNFTAIGYVTANDGKVVFSNELKTKNYAELTQKN